MPLHFSNKYPSLRPAAVETLIRWYKRFTRPLSPGPRGETADQQMPGSGAGQLGASADVSGGTAAADTGPAASPISLATDGNLGPTRDTLAPYSTAVTEERLQDSSLSPLGRPGFSTLANEVCDVGGATAGARKESVPREEGGNQSSTSTVRAGVAQGSGTPPSPCDGAEPGTDGPASSHNTTTIPASPVGEPLLAQTGTSTAREHAAVTEGTAYGQEGKGSVGSLSGIASEGGTEPTRTTRAGGVGEGVSDQPGEKATQEEVSSKENESTEAAMVAAGGAGQGGESDMRERETKRKEEEAEGLEGGEEAAKDGQHEVPWAADEKAEGEAKMLNKKATSGAAREGEAGTTWPHPKAALVLTSLPNLRVYALHRMITAHYKMHDATPLMLLLGK